MENNSKIISYLSNSQEDLMKIIKKHRMSHHKLSVEEIMSELNNYVIVKADVLLKKKPDLNHEANFKRFLYAMARNFIKWSSRGGYSNKDQKYFQARADYTVQLDDGPQTVFDFVCSQIGEEDDYFKSLNESEKYQNLSKWILEYNHFLTDRQKNILHYALKGKRLDHIADALKVTRQAVSAITLKAYESIKHQIKLSQNHLDETYLLNRGHKSINYLFGDERKKSRALKNSVT